jgi:hypothetical protein
MPFAIPPRTRRLTPRSKSSARSLRPNRAGGLPTGPDYSACPHLVTVGEGSAARFHLRNFAQFFVLGSSEPELNRHRWSDEASMLPLHHQSTSHMCAMVVEFTTATVLRQRKGDACASPFSLQRFLRGCHPRRPRQKRHYLPQVQAGRARNLGPKICITRTRVRRKPLCLGGGVRRCGGRDRRWGPHGEDGATCRCGTLRRHRRCSHRSMNWRGAEFGSSHCVG